MQSFLSQPQDQHDNYHCQTTAVLYSVNNVCSLFSAVTNSRVDPGRNETAKSTFMAAAETKTVSEVFLRPSAQ
jgi:hypothetical protein